MEPKLHRRLTEWWADDTLETGRTSLDDPDVQRLISRISPGSRVTDLRGTMSLNLKLDPAGFVLRVHQPWVSRERLLALQQVRRQLSMRGLTVPVATKQDGRTALRCGIRWAETETYVPHERLKPIPESYLWLFRAAGRLHRELSELDVAVPRPPVATYATPGSLRRWLPVTEHAIHDEPEARDIARLLRTLISRLRSQWISAVELPMRLVHGDIRLSNVCRTPNGDTVYLDFGFMARRPRIHELAYALAWMVITLDKHRTPEKFPWERVPQLIEEYEVASESRLTTAERKALAPYIAAVPLYFACIAGFTSDPARQLREKASLLYLSEWLLAHPEAVLGYTASR